MQHFINKAAIERALGEAFGARAHYYLLGLIAAAMAFGISAPLAAIWLGLALLTDQASEALAIRLPASARRVRLALDITRSASLAAAPAMAWFSATPFGAALAVGLLCVLALHTGLNARHGRLQTLASATPYAALGLLFLLNVGAGQGIAIGALAAFAFIAALQHAHSASLSRAQDREWLRIANMGALDEITWEIDYENERVFGAERLAALLGRQITYDDIIDHALFTPAPNRAIARETFAPVPGPARHTMFEHEAALEGGGLIRLTHHTFLHTTPDGQPLRLTCRTRKSQDAQSQIMHADASAAFALQRQALRTLANELSEPFEFDGEAAATLSGDMSRLLRTLTEHGAQIESRVGALARARHAAENANLAKSQFLASMSHELRTPLNAIIGYAEMLLEDAEDRGEDAVVQDLQRILTAAKHLLTLINEILDLSKIEAGRVDVIPTAFDPTEQIQELVDTVRPLAEQNGNTLTLRTALQGASANTDAVKMRQCVLNLLSNAAKFTSNGAIDVTFEHRPVKGVMHLIVAVRDSGIGISKAQMSRLFRPFMQADPTISQQYGGTGLGLTITRRLAQLLGGDVLAESTPGEGSTFTLRVPANYVDAEAARGAAAKVDDIQGATDAPLVLVIEDEPDARELVARALTRAGFSVLGVGGGEVGLTLARAKNPALILLDIYLPDRSGWRVLQSLKHDPKTHDIPVVVLSMNEDRAHALSLGAAEHMVKPADRDVLAATVMRLARLAPRPHAAAPVVAPRRKTAS